MFYQNELERIVKELYERKEDLLSELKELPAGELYVSDTYFRKYYQRLPAKGNRKKERRYGVKKKPEILLGLVRKEYINEAVKVIDKDIKVLDQSLEKYIPTDELSVMNEFLSEYPELEKGLFYGGPDYDEWKKLLSRIENYRPEARKHTAADGTDSFSKNEVYIASRLDHYNIVYRWDCPTGIPGLMRVPDFTILRKRDNKKLYWEHLGMMDVPSYREDNKQKIAEYEAAGIVPWDNLILTYDTVEGGLRGELIEATIRGWLL